MNDYRLMRVLLRNSPTCLPETFTRTCQWKINHLDIGLLLCYWLVVMYVAIKWCSWSVATSLKNYFRAPTLQKLPYARHIAKYFHVIKGAFSKYLGWPTFIFAPGVEQVGHCRRSQTLGYYSSVYAFTCVWLKRYGSKRSICASNMLLWQWHISICFAAVIRF